MEDELVFAAGLLGNGFLADVEADVDGLKVVFFGEADGFLTADEVVFTEVFLIVAPVFGACAVAARVRRPIQIKDDKILIKKFAGWPDAG